MFSTIFSNKSWLKAKNQINCKIPSRNIGPICGPPRFPMSNMQKALIGGGTIVAFMIIPTLGVLSTPSWAKKHQNLGKANLPKEEEEVPPEE